VIVGKNAQLTTGKLQEQGIDCIITVNTTCFNTDKMAINFLNLLYKSIFQGLTIHESFNEAMK
jgi:hypothetical protein